MTEHEGVQVGIRGKLDAGEGATLQAVDAQNVAIEAAAQAILTTRRRPGRRRRRRSRSRPARSSAAARSRYSAAVAATVSCGASFTATISSVVVAVVDGRAVGHGPRQGSLRAGVEVRRIVAARLELDLLQQRLIVRDRTRAGKDPTHAVCGFQRNVMPFTVPLVAPPTVRVSPSPGNEPAVILTSAPLRTVSSASVSVTAGESNTAAPFSWNVGVCRD